MRVFQRCRTKRHTYSPMSHPQPHVPPHAGFRPFPAEYPIETQHTTPKNINRPIRLIDHPILGRAPHHGQSPQSSWESTAPRTEPAILRNVDTQDTPSISSRPQSRPRCALYQCCATQHMPRTQRGATNTGEHSLPALVYHILPCFTKQTFPRAIPPPPVFQILQN